MWKIKITRVKISKKISLPIILYSEKLLQAICEIFIIACRWTIRNYYNRIQSFEVSLRFFWGSAKWRQIPALGICWNNYRIAKISDLLGKLKINFCELIYPTSIFIYQDLSLENKPVLTQTQNTAKLKCYIVPRST